MIFTERTITVVNDSATINKPLVLYRGDKNIELKITIAESQFKFRNTDASNVIETTDASYAQLVINTPYNSPIFSDVAATKNGAVIFVITEGMIDEIREVGAYEIQIRLLDDNKQSRASIPPVSNAIEIREPIAIEDGSAVDSNAVNVAKVNRALTTTSAPLEVFDSQGNYIKKTWGDGDPITDAALNKIEVGIDGVNKKIGNVNSQIKENKKVLNDRLNKIENGENLKSLNIDALKDYTIDILTDISYGLNKATTFTMSGFNGSDLVQIPISRFDKTKKYTIQVSYRVIANRGSFVLKCYDNTWGQGKWVYELYTPEMGKDLLATKTFDPSTYEEFVLFRFGQTGQDWGTQIEINYIKVIEADSFAKVDDFQVLYDKYGETSSYTISTINELPKNMTNLLNESLEIPGTEVLNGFNIDTFTDYIYNIEKPLQVITTEGNGEGIIQLPVSVFDNMEDSITIAISYTLNNASTNTKYSLRIFDSNWGQGIVKDLSGNYIKNKTYNISYTFPKNKFSQFVLFRFAMIGDPTDGKKVVLDVNYVKLFNTSEFPGFDDLNDMRDAYGDIEKYNLIDFKLIPKSLNVDKENKNVIMIGDSIANQFAGVICENNGNSEYNFINKCIGGETTLDTMARLGAIPYTILPPFTIPADTSNSDTPTLVSSLFVDVDFHETNGSATWKNGYLSNYSATPQGINPYSSLKCEIAGIKGTLYFTRNVGSTYFKRDTAGEAVTIDRPTNVIPIDTSSYDKNAVYTCFMGTNEGWCNRFFEKDRSRLVAGKSDAELLFSYYKLIAQYIKTNNFLFMGFYMCAFLDQQEANSRQEFWDYFEELMSKEFGNKYFSVRKYLREIGYVDASVTLVAQDIQDIKDGKIPITASTGDANGVHVTGRMAACVGNEILKRLKSLGYINSYNTIDVLKYSNGQSSTNPDDYA